MGIRRTITVLTVGTLLLSGGSGLAATNRQVAMENDYFYPSSVTVPQGGSVSWNPADGTHTATDGTSMGLFDSGLASVGDPSFVFTFTTAANYPIVCTLHEAMVGRVRVPLRAGLRSGTADGPFDVTWASQRLGDGYVADVQVRRPGRPWRAWRRNVVTRGDRFRPTQDGTYRFRSRLGNDAGNAGWSEVVEVRVRT